MILKITRYLHLQQLKSSYHSLKIVLLKSLRKLISVKTLFSTLFNKAQH